MDVCKERVVRLWRIFLGKSIYDLLELLSILIYFVVIESASGNSVVVDPDGIIVAWYLPGIWTEHRQVRSRNH